MAADARRGWHHGNSTMVVNISGTGSHARYEIGNLHEKFTRMGGTTSGACQVKECDRDGSATAHVRKMDGRSDDDWHLCWVCAIHNHPTYTAPYGLRHNAKLVSVKALRAAFG